MDGRPRVAYLSGGTQGTPSAQAYLDALRAGLAEVGQHEGTDYDLRPEYAANNPTQFKVLADKVLDDPRVTVIVVGDTRFTEWVAPQAQTPNGLPVVTAISFDLVHFGRIKALDAPGRRVTGITATTQGLNWTRMELLKRIVPRARRVATLRPEMNVCVLQEEHEAHVAAEGLGITPIPLVVTDPTEFGAVVAHAGADALFVLRGPLVVYNPQTLVTAIESTRLPALYPYRLFAEAGGLIAYGPDRLAMQRRAGVYAGRILQGADPAKMPMEGPRQFELVINQTTAAWLAEHAPHAEAQIAIPDAVWELATIVGGTPPES